ncbi:unnamed protein product [Ceutorhynchus assimilis]|uniref:SUN domain-containing protein n=1 Tax=Ceutorhynchus assimilis TaxID=467358 RepID=A0A9N9MZB4_9CUCU|nr:unnamed protein product [Ceutorhynchus assimilis]
MVYQKRKSVTEGSTGISSLFDNSYKKKYPISDSGYYTPCHSYNTRLSSAISLRIKSNLQDNDDAYLLDENFDPISESNSFYLDNSSKSLLEYNFDYTSIMDCFDGPVLPCPGMNERRKWLKIFGIVLVITNFKQTVRKVVDQEITKIYSDKTGKTDFALESAGGRVVHLSQGTNGGVLIKLLGPIKIDAVSLEHIPKTISPSGDSTTAPKDFSVWGMKSVTDKGSLLGQFSYKVDGPLVQIFSTTHSVNDVYDFVELNIQSNHGNEDFTCVYRFRVHGTMDKPKDK